MTGGGCGRGQCRVVDADGEDGIERGGRIGETLTRVLPKKSRRGRPNVREKEY